MIRLFLLLALSCSRPGPITAARAVALSAAPASCLTVAIPGDGIDDRAAIQAACDAPQRCAYLPTGAYDVVTIPRPPLPGRRAIAMIVGDGCSIFGDGPANTVVSFRGSASGQDWDGIRLTGTSPSLHDLTLRTTGAVTETTEWTHAVKMLGPSTGPSMYRVTIDHPILSGEKRGDCLDLVAYNDGRLITGGRIHDNEFEHCDRSGVAVHSGTRDLEITDNHFPDTGNTGLDFEGTGDTSDVLIAFNRFELSPGDHGQQEIQLQLVDDVRVTSNVLLGRSIDVHQGNRVRIDHNTITLTQPTSGAVISVGKDASHVTIERNTLTRSASAGPGSIVRAAPHGTGTPDHLTINDNVVTQLATGHIVEASGIVGLDVLRNHVTYAGGPGFYGVWANGSAGEFGVRTTDVHVWGNTFTGPLRGVVGVSGSYAGAGSVGSSDNVTTGAIGGIVCSGVAAGSGVLGPVTSTRDSIPAPACGLAGFVTNGP